MIFKNCNKLEICQQRSATMSKRKKRQVTTNLDLGFVKRLEADLEAAGIDAVRTDLQAGVHGPVNSNQVAQTGIGDHTDGQRLCALGHRP